MKKIVFTVIGLILVLFILYFVGTGFIKNSSVFIMDYTLSEDGSEITLKVGTTSSVGYIRSISVHQQEGGKLYLDCYSAFGGINGKIGAKDTFIFPLNEDTSVIAVYRNSDCYQEVLVRDSDGIWQRAVNQ